MNNKHTVTVGICAYNEEKNIALLIKTIVKQSTTGWRLKEIIVYLDGCTDNTFKEIETIKIRNLIIINNTKRNGKSYGINKILKSTTGDFLVMFDADILIKKHDTITTLLKPMLENKQISLVGGCPKPNIPKSFFERAIYCTYIVYNESRTLLNGGNNIYGCSGQILAMTKKFTNQITIPNGTINDDDFIYFTCLKLKNIFNYVNNAVVYYNLPKNLIDFLKQSFRSNPSAVTILMHKHFGNFVKKEYKRPVLFMIRSVFKAFKIYPLETLFIIFVNILMKPLYPIITSNYGLSWFTARSTK